MKSEKLNLKRFYPCLWMLVVLLAASGHAQNHPAYIEHRVVGDRAASLFLDDGHVYVLNEVADSKQLNLPFGRSYPSLVVVDQNNFSIEHSYIFEEEMFPISGISIDSNLFYMSVEAQNNVFSTENESSLSLRTVDLSKALPSPFNDLSPYKNFYIKNNQGINSFPLMDDDLSTLDLSTGLYASKQGIFSIFWQQNYNDPYFLVHIDPLSQTYQKAEMPSHSNSYLQYLIPMENDYLAVNLPFNPDFATNADSLKSGGVAIYKTYPAGEKSPQLMDVIQIPGNPGQGVYDQKYKRLLFTDFSKQAQLFVISQKKAGSHDVQTVGAGLKDLDIVKSIALAKDYIYVAIERQVLKDDSEEKKLLEGTMFEDYMQGFAHFNSQTIIQILDRQSLTPVRELDTQYLGLHSKNEELIGAEFESVDFVPKDIKISNDGKNLYILSERPAILSRIILDKKGYPMFLKPKKK